MRRVRLIIITVIILTILSLYANETSTLFLEEDYTPNNLLRLHVIANSNSLEDQALKRVIRNEIIKESKSLFLDITNISEASNIIKENLDYLTGIAQNKIKSLGKDYDVNIVVGEFDFPTRSYGNLTLAKGRYQAVRVIIGEGSGANWWCVLFPPLCFVDSVDKVDPKLIRANQEERLSSIEVEFKFKFLEILEKRPEWLEENLKLANIFSLKD